LLSGFENVRHLPLATLIAEGFFTGFTHATIDPANIGSFFGKQPIRGFQHTLMERTLPSVFTVLHHGVQADTGTGRSDLVYHSGLPRGSSLHSRLEVLR
jgi:hypothetical protein